MIRWFAINHKDNILYSGIMHKDAYILVYETFLLDHENKRYGRKCKLHLILATIKFWPADLDCKKIGIQGSETFIA